MNSAINKNARPTFVGRAFFMIILFLQSKGHPIIFLSVNLSYTHVAVALHKAELFGTTEHADITRPSLCVNLFRTILKVVVYKGSESICANAFAPYLGFANANSDSTVYSLTIFNLVNPLIVLINWI